MPETVSQKIMTLLSRERHAIMGGDFNQITADSAEKVDLFAALQEARPSRNILSEVNNAMARNQRLLAAAIAGVNDAKKRLSVLETVRGSLQVYDKNGQMASVRTNRPGIERKA